MIDPERVEKIRSVDRRGFLGLLSSLGVALGLVKEKPTTPVTDAADETLPPVTGKAIEGLVLYEDDCCAQPVSENLRDCDIKWPPGQAFDIACPRAGFVMKSAKLLLPNNDLGLLAEEVDLRYWQNVTQLVDDLSEETYMQTMEMLGTPVTYEEACKFCENRGSVFYIGGKVQGILNIGRLAGPTKLMTQFWQQYGNVANARDNQLVLQSTEEEFGEAKSTFSLSGCVITDCHNSTMDLHHGLTIVESASIMFTGLSL